MRDFKIEKYKWIVYYKDKTKPVNKCIPRQPYLHIILVLQYIVLNMVYIVQTRLTLLHRFLLCVDPLMYLKEVDWIKTLKYYAYFVLTESNPWLPSTTKEFRIFIL